MRDPRYSRNEALFGAEGQDKIGQSAVAIVGLGGLGSHVAQQLAYLGVRTYVLVDDDIVTESSMNRLIGGVEADVRDGTPKVTVAERLIQAVSPSAAVRSVRSRVEAHDVPGELAAVDVVFGCLDRDLARLKLTAISAGLKKPYFDLATDTGEDESGQSFGGRVVFCDGTRCLYCLTLLDQEEMTRDSMSPEHRDANDRIYGVHQDSLDQSGPSVVSINGAVASLAITEFMFFITGLGEPSAHLNYYGERRLIRRSIDLPRPNCPYCWNASRS